MWYNVSSCLPVPKYQYDVESVSYEIGYCLGREK